MSLPQTILFAVGFFLFLFWFASVLPEQRRKDLALGSIETLFGGLGMTLIGISAFYEEDGILPGLFLLAFGVPMTLAYTIEKYRQRSP